MSYLQIIHLSFLFLIQDVDTFFYPVSYCFLSLFLINTPMCLLSSQKLSKEADSAKPNSVYFLFYFTDCASFYCLQNIVRGCSVLLGPGTSGLWRALAQSQNHIPGGGPAELTELLEQYAQILARNMKLTYLNPVALVAPNIGELRRITDTRAHTLGHNTKANPFSGPIQETKAVFKSKSLQMTYSSVLIM